jgi:hypothetical protein
MIIVAGASAAADASPITISFAGVVGSVSAGLSGSFTAGDLLSGSYTFESTTAPRPGADVNGAVYDAVTDVSFALGSYSAATAGPAPNGEIQVENDPINPLFFDRYALVSRATDGLVGLPVNGQPLTTFGFRLDDTTNTAFSTALTLPTSLALSDFTSSAFFVFFGTELVNGTLTSLSVGAASPVPEPATVGLTALGLAIVGLRRFRRTNRSH